MAAAAAVAVVAAAAGTYTAWTAGTAGQLMIVVSPVATAVQFSVLVAVIGDSQHAEEQEHSYCCEIPTLRQEDADSDKDSP